MKGTDQQSGNGVLEFLHLGAFKYNVSVFQGQNVDTGEAEEEAFDEMLTLEKGGVEDLEPYIR